MKKNVTRILLGIFLLSSIQLWAQKKELTLIDAFRPTSYPDRLSNTNWRPGTNTFTFVEENTLMEVEPKKNAEPVEVLSLDQLNKALTEADIDSVKSSPKYSWLHQNAVIFDHNNQYILYNLNKQEAQRLFGYNEDAENPDYQKDRSLLAFTIDNNLYIAGRSMKKKVTTESNKEIVYGQEVHRREFGITKGTFWSPSGDKLAFYRKDETMVSDYPIVDIETRIASVKNTKYPMAGETSHEVTIGVFDVDNDNIIYLKTGDPKDQYLTNVTWGPHGKVIYVAVLNRGQDHMKLNAYSAIDGTLIKTLFEEKHEKYVEPEHGPVFLPWDKDKFLWYSERDNFNHLYLYNAEGELIKQVTSGDYEVLSIDGFNKDDKTLFITSTKDSPIERHLYSVEPETGKMKKITEREGTHNVLVSENGEYFLDVYSNVETGSEYKIRKTKNNKEVQTLVEANNPLAEDYKLGKTSLFTIKAADNETDLHCRMIKPHDFDPSKKYPVLIYVYGGPHAQLVQNTWLGGGNIFLNYMANQGYIVFTLDNRGSAHRGLEFENIIHRNLGEAEVADQMKGVEYLKKQDFVEAERIGVDGWSYGGFMTINLLLEHPETFKVGVAGGPVIDWKYYEVMYGERYMDTPQENPDGYKNACLLEKAGNLDSRLLIIHGTADPTVVWQHSLQFINAAIKNRKLVDYFVYPGQEHNVRGIERLHLYMKIEQYFEDHL